MGGRLLLAAWLLVAAALAGTAAWLYAAGAPEPAPPELVLALPPAPAAQPAAPAPPPPTPEAGAAATAPPPAGAPAEAALPATPPPTDAAPPPARPAEPPPQPAQRAEPAPPASAAPPAEAPAAAARLRDGPAAPPAPTARPAAARPRVAVIVSHLGLGEAATAAAIERLPPEVTLAFLPYAEGVAEWVRRARAAGHEVLLNLPMEPASFPQDDPGPKALLTSLEPGQNLERLQWVLDRASGYVGVMSAMGSRFLTSEEHMRPVLAALRERDLLFVDGGASPRSVAGALAGDLGLASAANDRFLDSEPSRAAIDRRLKEVEQIARETGAAVAVGRPYPATIERIADWAAGLAGRGVALVPISAVAGRQGVR